MSAINVIPSHVFGPDPSPVTLPGYDTLRDTAPSPSEQQLTLAAANAPLRYGYGRVRIAPLVANAVVDAAGALLLDCVIGEGPIDSVVAMEINDAAAPAGVTVTIYDGTQTTADAALVAAWALQGVTYADIRPGVAYAVVKIPPSIDVAIDERSITFEVKMRKVYDPRSGLTVWSDNPALALADFLASSTLGPGDTVDWTSVGAAADRCDQVLGGKKRHTIGIVFDEQKPKQDVEETLRAAAMCFVAREGPVTYLVADAPVDVSTTLHLQQADWQPLSLRYSQKNGEFGRNSVSVRITNTAVKPWGEGYTDPPLVTAEVASGDVDELTTVLNATWIQDYAEGVRFQKRYFNEYTLGIRTLEFDAFEKAWSIRRGDVIRLSNGSDLVAKPVRVLRIMPLGFARVHIVAEEYYPEMYSDDVVTAPPSIDSTLPDPRTVLAPTGFTMVEEVYLDQSQGATVATGAKYLSRLRVTWTASPDRYLLDYAVEFLQGTSVIFQGSSLRTEFVSPAVEQGKLYTARVRARNVLGFTSAEITGNYTAQGKLLPPSDVPSILQAFEIGGIVLTKIEPAIDIDTLRYHWKYTPNVTTGGSWETAERVDIVDGLLGQFRGLPPGTHRFYVKALDSVGRESVNAKFRDVTVTTDSDAFIQDREYSSPTLTNMVVFQNEGETFPRWISNRVGSWDSLFPLAMTSYPNPITTYGTGTSRFQGESWDIGQAVTAQFSLTATVTNHSGAATFALEVSNDGSTWTPQPGLSWSGTTRFIRPAVETTGAMEIVGKPKISLVALSRSESGQATTLSSGGKLIEMSGRYAAAQDVQATAVNTNSARACVIDRLLLNPQQGLMFTQNTGGTGASNEYSYISIMADAAIGLYGPTVAGDIFEYEVFLDPSSPAPDSGGYTGGGAFLEFMDLSQIGGAGDQQTGANMIGGGMDAAVRGKWYYRSTPIDGSHLGKTVRQVYLVNECDTPGTPKAIYRNVRIKNGATVKLAIYGTSGEPARNVNALVSANVSNIRVGPSNSFLLYAFNAGTGAQIAADAQWSFRGF
ncbi:MAG TPA: hypothetical protein DEH78_14825 [Solibacterales bacterium]|nr:hypothetical protein [Bryobacterales bacterium]